MPKSGWPTRVSSSCQQSPLLASATSITTMWASAKQLPCSGANNLKTGLRTLELGRLTPSTRTGHGCDDWGGCGGWGCFIFIRNIMKGFYVHSYEYIISKISLCPFLSGFSMISGLHFLLLQMHRVNWILLNESSGDISFLHNASYNLFGLKGQKWTQRVRLTRKLL